MSGDAVMEQLSGGGRSVDYGQPVGRGSWVTEGMRGEVAAVREYREKVVRTRQQAATLGRLAELVGLLEEMMLTPDLRLAERNWSGQRERVMETVGRLGWNKEVAEQVLFVGRVADGSGSGAVRESQERIGGVVGQMWNLRKQKGLMPKGVRRYRAREMIVAGMDRLMADRLGQPVGGMEVAGPLRMEGERSRSAGGSTKLSDKDGLSRRTRSLEREERDIYEWLFGQDELPVVVKGKEKMVSRRELFTQWGGGYLEILARLKKAEADGWAGSSRQMRILDTRRWLKEQAGRAARGDRQEIVATPYVRQIVDRIKESLAKDNGIFKYLLFGQAGVGKTRLGVFANKEVVGKETVVVSFHHYLSFEEIVASPAVGVDMPTDRWGRLVKTIERWEGLDDGSFWREMERVYAGLPEEKAGWFDTVEAMVAGVGLRAIRARGGKVETSVEMDDREVVRAEFMTRLKTARGLEELGLDEPESLEARYVRHVVLKAMADDKCVMFDEFDKAGPHALMGLLSLMSVSPGSWWESQVGRIWVPDDFFICGTSNSKMLGNQMAEMMKQAGVVVEAGMNSFIADRADQIPIKPLPVRDALMVSAVLTADRDGRPVLTAEEQYQLVALLSYVFPALQSEDLPTPITGRVLRGVCSRLVKRSRDGQWKRTSHTVEEAARITILRMHRVALADSAGVVEKWLDRYAPLIGGDRVVAVGTEMPWIDPVDWQTARVAESWFSQPLVAAIAETVDSEQVVAGRAAIVERDWLKWLAGAEIMKVPRDDRPVTNGWQPVIVDGRLVLTAEDPGTGRQVGRLESAKRPDCTGGVVESADQGGELVAVRFSGGGDKWTVVGPGGVVVDRVEKAIIDPVGRYVLARREGVWRVHSVADCRFGRAEEKVAGGQPVMVSRDGRVVVWQREQDDELVVDVLQEQGNWISLPIAGKWEEVKMWGNSMLVGKRDDHPAAVLVN